MGQNFIADTPFTIVSAPVATSILPPLRGNAQGNTAGWPRNQTAHCFSLLFVFGEKNPYFFFRRFRPFLERGLRFLHLILIKVNFLKLKFTIAINARTSRAKVHPAATSFYKNLHQNDKRTGGIIMFNRKNNLIKELKRKIECQQDTITQMNVTIEKLRNELAARVNGEHVVGEHCKGCKHQLILRNSYFNGAWRYDYACVKDRKAICGDFDG